MKFAATKDAEDPHPVTAFYRMVVDFLGGPSVLEGPLDTPMHVHRLLMKGLPGSTVRILQDRVEILHDPATLQLALGFTKRTGQRKTTKGGAGEKDLSQAQSSRVWQFTEILAKAHTVFGDQATAEKWMASPAIGLDRQRPIDLLATSAGTKMVEDLLVRMEYGVYA